MISWLKNHFIPHEGNNHRPHILHSSNLRNIVVVILFLEIITLLGPTLIQINNTKQMAAVLPAVLSGLTNNERQSQNLQTLTVNIILNQAAEMKAKDMATKGYFAHTSPEGKTPWYWLEKAGYQYQYAGENLAVNFYDSIDVTNAWMNSPTHKANIVKGAYTEVGTGIAFGIYKGKETTFVAQIYANPLSKTTEERVVTKEIKKTPKIVASDVEVQTNILGAEIVPSEKAQSFQNPTFLQKLLASPRNTTNIILYIIFGMITTSLLLYVFMKMRNYHKDLITNGLIVLAIIGAIFVANYFYSYKNMVITQSLDYSNQDNKE